MAIEAHGTTASSGSERSPICGHHDFSNAALIASQC
jgi:hypothetical protein